MEKKNRRMEIDILKGISIIFMVLGHAYFPLTDFIYLFHMAVFFMAAGFLFQEKYTESIKGVGSFCARRVKSLWLPHFIWNAIFVLLHNFFIRVHVYTNNPLFLEQVSGASNVIYERIPFRVMLDVIIKGMYFAGGTQIGGAFWFFGVMLGVSLLYALIDFLIKRVAWGRRHIYAVQGVISLMLLCAGFFLGSRILSYYILFYLGIVLRKHEKRDRKTSFRLAVLSVSFVILLLCGAIGEISLSDNFYENPAYLIVASLAGWLFLYEISCFLVKARGMGRLLEIVGQNSLAVMILHLLCFKPINYIALKLSGQPTYLMAAFPVLYTTGAWWIAYGIAGIVIPVVCSCLWKKMLLKTRKIKSSCK